MRARHEAESGMSEGAVVLPRGLPSSRRAPLESRGALWAGGYGGPLPLGTPRSLDLMTVLAAVFQFGSHPTYSSVGNSTRGSMAELRIPGQGPYLGLCTILSSEINNNKSIKMVTKGWRNVSKPNYLYPRTLRLLYLHRQHHAYSLWL